jgi:hypothetical protein
MEVEEIVDPEVVLVAVDWMASMESVDLVGHVEMMGRQALMAFLDRLEKKVFDK